MLQQQPRPYVAEEIDAIPGTKLVQREQICQMPAEVNSHQMLTNLKLQSIVIWQTFSEANSSR
jgi:hypothetical protein